MMQKFAEDDKLGNIYIQWELENSGIGRWLSDLSYRLSIVNSQ